MGKTRTSRSKLRRRVAVVTGTRAEFGLLVPVMRAIQKRRDLELVVVAGGAHLLPPARTIGEVQAQFTVAATVPMQSPQRAGRAGAAGREADAEALGHGVIGFAKAFTELRPDWVVVLGDRIEAFAAAAAASVSGIALCHIHGGDRAEGIADEAMRHAITKLAHLHCAATKQSAERIVRMGERPELVRVTGSPAIDGLSKVRPMSDAKAKRLGDPHAVVLLHPIGRATVGAEHERAKSAHIVARVACRLAGVPAGQERLLLLDPNHDPGSQGIRICWEQLASGGVGGGGWTPDGKGIVIRLAPPDPRKTGVWHAPHLPRPEFLSLLARLAARGGVLVGNSSAGLIEASALGVRVINIPPRQNGRERAANVFDHDGMDRGESLRAFMQAPVKRAKLFGDGRAGERIAKLLAEIDPHDYEPRLLRKLNAY